MKIGSSADVGSVPADSSAHRASMQGAKAATETGEIAVSAKVDAIRRAIREGRFAVNAEAIADRLIDDARALMTRRAP